MSMPNDLLIRRVVTADRGKVLVSTHDVLTFLQTFRGETFTTRDIAMSLAQSRQELALDQMEYAVRRAVAWLLTRGYVARSKDNPPRTLRKAPNWATRYVKVNVMRPCDVALLNKIFMRA